MRLIDADALKRYIPTRMDMQDLYLPVHFKTLIDEQPTVDAVPSSLLDQSTKRCEALRKQLREAQESYEKHLNDLEAQLPKRMW